MSLKPGSSLIHDGEMKTIMKPIMKLDELRTIDPLPEFLSGTQAVAFSIMNDKDPAIAGSKTSW